MAKLGIRSKEAQGERLSDVEVYVLLEDGTSHVVRGVIGVEFAPISCENPFLSAKIEVSVLLGGVAK